MFRTLLSRDALRSIALTTVTAGLVLATGCDKSDPASTTTTTSAPAAAQASDPTVQMNADPDVNARNAQGGTLAKTPSMATAAAAVPLPNVPATGSTIDAHGQPMNAQPSLTGNRGVGGQMYRSNTPGPANPSSTYGASNGVGASPYAAPGTFNTPSAPGSMNGTQPMNTLGSVQTPGSQSNGATGAPSAPPQNMNGTSNPNPKYP